MQIIFVIQEAPFTCQDGRIYGSPDGVKSIAASVNLFFTHSRLLSYINQFARGYRVMMATVLLLGILMGLPNKAIGQVITGAIVNASSLTCGSAPLIASGGILYVGDGISATTLNMDVSLDLSCLGPIQLIVRNNATIDFTSNVSLTLSAGSIITIIKTPPTGLISGWPCNSQKEIYIGTVKYTTCNGGGPGNPLNDFDHINKFGGTGNVSSNSPVCTGNTINLAAIPSIPGNTYLWTGPLGEIYNTQNITLSSATVLMAGPYEVKITNTTGNSVTAVTTVVVAPSITNNIAGGTSPICSGSTPALLTGVPTGGNGTYNPYLWESSTSSSTTGFSPATGINNAQAYQPGSLTQTTWFRRSVTSGCTDISAPIEIIVTPTVGTPVFALGVSSARDQGAVPVTYTATASNSTGITYSLDAASLTGGNSIDPLTGKVTYVALWSWKSIITATATGCNGTKTADHVVGVNWCYALFTANGALSCAGASKITGNVGTFVGATTGFTIPTVLLPPGRIDAEASTASAQAAAQTVAVYNDLAAIPCGISTAVITLAGPTILTPNVYCYDGALTISGDVTLDGLGNPNAVFIFKINGALTTNTLSKIKLAGLADYHNVYWRVYGAVVLSGLEFKGTIVNEGAFTVNTGAALEGRALSINGAIAITDNKITSDCYPLFSVPDNTKPIFVPPADISECVENLSNVAYNPLTTVINPDRPDYYTFSDVDTRLDLNTALFTDDEPLTCPANIRWEIVFSPASNLNIPYDIVTKAPITGNGQPSEHIGNILFPGDGVNFNPVIHHITWWIKDCAGNESPPQTRTITIKPRPKVQ